MPLYIVIYRLFLNLFIVAETIFRVHESCSLQSVVSDVLKEQSEKFYKHLARQEHNM